MTFLGYAMIGILFAGLLDRKRPFFVLALTFFFTAAGLALRYLLEYGEISNAMNFTPFNIALYMIAIPPYCLLVYYYSCT
jgi:uncharacterized membrane protein YjjP (DUF1212 family)